MSRILKVLNQTAEFSLTLIDSSRLLEDIIAIHEQQLDVSRWMTDLLSAANMIQANEKLRETTIDISVVGDGYIRSIDAISDGNINKASLVTAPTDNAMAVPLADALSFNSIRLRRSHRQLPTQTGQAECVSEQLAAALTHYYTVSEQLLTLFAFDYSHETERTSGGIMIQLLPHASQATLDYILTLGEDLPVISERLADGQTLTDIAADMMPTANYRIVHDKTLAYRCDCSRKRVEAALISLGTRELKDLLAGDHPTAMHCHYCQTTYNFNRAELAAIIEEMTHDSH